jgi:hypothetical protein
MTMSESEHAPAVYRCLLAWTRSPALAEELTAETFYGAIVADQPGCPSTNAPFGFSRDVQTCSSNNTGMQ